MDYLELTVFARPEAVETAADLLRRVARAGVSIEPALARSDDEGRVLLDVTAAVRLRAWLTASAESRAAVAGLRRQLRASEGIVRPLSCRTVTDSAWADVWKRYFRPMRIGRSIVIKPPWRRYAARPRDLVIDIDPGMAFGTGQHQTTRLALEAIERHLKPGARALDLGSGSGILAIAAARLGARHVDALDIDPLAVQATKDNAARNSAGRIVRARHGSLGEDWPFPWRPGGRYALIVANISSRIAQDLARPVIAALEPGGVAIVSGLVRQHQAACARALRNAGGRVVESRTRGDWVALVVQRPTAPAPRMSTAPGRPRGRARRSPSADAVRSPARSRRSSR